MFDRLYFDSSVLVEANWPRVSAALERVFRLANSRGLGLFLPEPVEIELEHHWMRELDDRRRKVEDVTRRLDQYISGVLKFDTKIGLPPDADALSSYRQQVRAIKDRWHVETVALTGRPLAAFVSMSALRQPPFQENEAGFRDSVIFHSILDHLAATPDAVAGIVARDKMFRAAAIEAQRSGVFVEWYESLKTAHDAMMELLMEEARDRLDQETERVRETLERMKPEITTFVDANLVVSPFRLAAFLTVHEIQRAEVTRIANVALPAPLARGESLRFSFEAEVKLHVVMEKFRPPNEPRLRVGEAGRTLNPAGLDLGDISETALGLTRTEEAVLERTVQIDATARYIDGEYTNIAFEAVRLRGSGGLTDLMFP